MNNKKKKYYDGKIPFCIRTNYSTKEKYREQQSYEQDYSEGFEWRDNCSFYANLEFKSMSRGRSAANFDAVLWDVDGAGDEMNNFLEDCHVNIFMTDMLEIIQNTLIHEGVTNTYLWTFCKRGSNYGIQLVHD